MNIEKTEQENLDLELQEEAFDPSCFTIPDEINLEFKVTYDDVFAGLNHTDKVDGTSKKQKNLTILLSALALMEWAMFLYKQNGIVLIMAMIFTGLILFLKKMAVGVNHKIAKAFAEEEKQTLVLTNDGLCVSGKQSDYADARVRELPESYTLFHQKNHVFVIPKHLLTERENCGLSRKLKEKLGENYQA